jgi:DNA-binding CsgD family transcriptional regulator
LLARFGVTADAEAVWRALLSDPKITVEGLQGVTGLTSADIDAAITALADASLVRGASSPTGVTAIDPTLAVETHIALRQRQLAEEFAQIAALRAALPALSDAYSRGRAEAGDQPGFETVLGLDNVRRQVYLAADRVRADVRSTEYLPHSDPDFRHGQAVQLAMLDRGVRDRTIVATDSLEVPALRQAYELMQQHGHLARTLPGITTRIIIYDRELAIVPVDPTATHLGAIFIRVQPVIDAYILMYEYMWDAASPIFNSPGNPEAPTGRAASILEMVALGTKDERIARSLGVGVRTIRRDVSELKSTLRVTSRAEIVTAALRKGWL